MSALLLRAITADDWPLWRELRRRALADAPEAFGATLAEWSGPGDTEERWRSRLTAVALNVVAALDGTPSGMVSATAPTDGEVELISMWVDPAARGRQVGDALVGTVLSWAVAQPAARVALCVRHVNAPAIALYRRHGFVDDGAAVCREGEPPERRMVRLLR